MKAVGPMAASDSTLTIEPPPFAAMTGANARVVASGAK